MSHISIIGLVGRAGAGKDTVAEILTEAEDAALIAFADALRNEIKEAFGVGIECMLRRDEKERPTMSLAIARCADKRFISRMEALSENPFSPRSPREILRLWGTEYRRSCDSYTYWIERLQATIDAHIAAGRRILVVTDVRYLNEAIHIQSIGGKLWRIKRPIADIAAVSHSSEADVNRIEVDLTIHNNGSLGQLVHAVRASFRETA